MLHKLGAPTIGLWLGRSLDNNNIYFKYIDEIERLDVGFDDHISWMLSVTIHTDSIQTFYFVTHS